MRLIFVRALISQRRVALARTTHSSTPVWRRAKAEYVTRKMIEFGDEDIATARGWFHNRLKVSVGGQKKSSGNAGSGMSLVAVSI